MHIVLLKAFAWCKMEVASDLADLQVAMGPASFIDLFLQFVCPPLPYALSNAMRIVEGPPFLPICLSHLLARVTARLFHCFSTIAAREGERGKDRDKSLRNCSSQHNSITCTFHT